MPSGANSSPARSARRSASPTTSACGLGSTDTGRRATTRFRSTPGTRRCESGWSSTTGGYTSLRTTTLGGTPARRDLDPIRGPSVHARLADHGVARQERRDSTSDGLGTLDLQEMARSVDRELLDVRERGAEELGDLDPERPGLRAHHRQHRYAKGGRPLGPERPLSDGGQLDSEEG